MDLFEICLQLQDQQQQDRNTHAHKILGKSKRPRKHFSPRGKVYFLTKKGRVNFESTIQKSINNFRIFVFLGNFCLPKIGILGKYFGEILMKYLIKTSVFRLKLMKYLIKTSFFGLIHRIKFLTILQSRNISY